MSIRFVTIGIVCVAILPTLTIAQRVKKAQPAKKLPAQAVDKRLSLEQIRKLIAIKTPDAIIGQEIQARGVSGDYSRQDVSKLRDLGAGSETVAALIGAIPFATLTVKTEPGATLKLDGGVPVIVGQDGVATILGIDPGSHQITAEKLYFTSATRSAVLGGREVVSIDMPLEWSVGFLTVSSNPEAAQIRMPGGKPIIGGRSRIPLPPGSATIVATAPMRKPVSQTIAIQPGKETVLSLTLPVDQDALQALATQIHSAFRAQQYHAVLDQSRRYLPLAGRDKNVLAEVAVSYLEQGSFSEFRSFARLALDAGGVLEFRALHHHAGWTTSLHPAIIQLTARELRFASEGPCGTDPFELPLAQLRIGNRERVFTRGGKSEGQSWEALNLIVPNRSNPKKTSNINLVFDPVGYNQRVTAIRELLGAMSR